jgi:hypothetical protein
MSIFQYTEKLSVPWKEVSELAVAGMGKRFGDTPAKKGTHLL